MKDIRPAIRALLLSDPALQAYVTTGGVSRIYPVVLPQGITAPSLVQNQISETSQYFNDGPVRLGTARIQLDAWALSADQSVVLGNMAHDVLSGFKGTISFGSNSPQDTLLVRAIFKDHGADDYDSVAKMYSRRRDFFVWFSET